MKTIHKYKLQPETEQQILMPIGADIIHVNSQNDHDVLVWALVDSDDKLVPVKFYVYGTGHVVSENIEQTMYKGTVHLNNGSLVFHIFSNI